MSNQTAILIFANSAEKDAERKSFLAVDVFSALNLQALKTVKKTNLPFFVFSENEQVGHNFGERFCNAIDTIFNKGFKNIITIGNDTPHLKTKHLKEAVQKLATNDLVLGPSSDGGFYLMAIKKEHFNKKTFLKLPWQSSQLQKCIASILSAKHLNFHFLEVLKDIDVKNDIKYILDSFKRIPVEILTILNTFIFTQTTIVVAHFIDYKETFFTPNSNKGSPFSFA